MDVLRRNTDYGLRMMVNLAKHSYNDQLMSARQLASDGNFSYQLGCKLLQRLHKAELVKSVMGPKGGFKLGRKPSEITLMDVINVMQGGVQMNKCLTGDQRCEFESECEVHTKLACLQLYIEGYLGGITLDEILQGRSTGRKKRRNQ